MTFVAPPRVTRHVRHLHKYTDSPVAAHHRFSFQLPGQPPVAIAATLGEFAGAIGQVDDAVLEHHAAHGDFSRWVLDVFHDRHLGGHLRKVERRWARGELGDLRHALTQPLSPLASMSPGTGAGRQGGGRRVTVMGEPPRTHVEDSAEHLRGASLVPKLLA